VTALLAPPLTQLDLPGLTELRAEFPAWTILPCVLLGADPGTWLTATRNSHVITVEGVTRMREALTDFEAGRGWF
jgi:hypothetical protein